MNKFRFLLFILTCVSLGATAQITLNTILYDKTGIIVENPDSASYIRIVQTSDDGSDLFMIREFYLSGAKKSIGASVKLIPLEYEGSYVSYYENGKKKQIANYHGGNLIDTAYNFYPNGQLYKATYKMPTDKTIEPSLIEESETYIFSMQDSTGKEFVIKGNGDCTEYDEDFKYVTGAGKIKDGVRDGLWAGELKKIKVKYSETYAKGKLISGESIDDDGTVRQYKKSSTQPLFQGDMTNFIKFIWTHLRYPMSAMQHNVQGKVYMQFTIEENGSVTNVHPTQAADKDLTAESIRMLKSLPKWEPGQWKGKKTKVIYHIPLSFTLSN